MNADQLQLPVGAIDAFSLSLTLIVYSTSSKKSAKFVQINSDNLAFFFIILLLFLETKQNKNNGSISWEQIVAPQKCSLYQIAIKSLNKFMNHNFFFPKNIVIK